MDLNFNEENRQKMTKNIDTALRLKNGVTKIIITVNHLTPKQVLTHYFSDYGNVSSA